MPKLLKICPQCHREFTAYLPSRRCCSRRCLAAFLLSQEYLESRFWKYVRKTENCFIWTGGRNPRYGKFSVSHREVYAHRFAYELAKGPIPNGMDVCHCCDNPICVRADHLFLGTRRENMRDAKSKNRTGAPRGASSPNAKLTESQVREILRLRADGWSRRALSVEYELSPNTISSIIYRKRWRHVSIQA